MANIPNFFDVNRKKIDFFSPQNIIKSKNNFLSQGDTVPLPSSIPSPSPSPTPSPTPTPFEFSITGTGNAEQIYTVASANFSNCILFFNASNANFDPYVMVIQYNGQPALSVNYVATKEGQSFKFYPGTGTQYFNGTFTNNTTIYFTS